MVEGWIKKKKGKQGSDEPSLLLFSLLIRWMPSSRRSTGRRTMFCSFYRVKTHFPIVIPRPHISRPDLPRLGPFPTECFPVDTFPGPAFPGRDVSRSGTFPGLGLFPVWALCPLSARDISRTGTFPGRGHFPVGRGTDRRYRR